MYDNYFRIILLITGILIIIFIIFSSKNKRKYKVYKTKNYDIKKTIDIKTNENLKNKKEININLQSTKSTNDTESKISLTANKSKQMVLSFEPNEEKNYIIIHSVAKNYFNIKEIYEFMNKKDFFLNDNGYYDKLYSDKYTSHIKFSVINSQDPGYLDKDRLSNPRIKGLSFFMQLPMNLDPIETFNEMVKDAKSFSKKYKGVLIDSNKKIINNKITNQLKNSITIYQNEF